VIRVYEEDGTPMLELFGHTDTVPCIAWRPDGQFLLSISQV
jgi:WD40 repeat protein